MLSSKSKLPPSQINFFFRARALDQESESSSFIQAEEQHLVIVEFPVCGKGDVGMVGVFPDREVALFEVRHRASDRYKQIIGPLELKGRISTRVFVGNQAEAPTALLTRVLHDNSDGVLRRARMQRRNPSEPRDECAWRCK